MSPKPSLQVLARQGREILNASGVHVDGAMLHSLVTRYLNSDVDVDFQMWVIGQIDRDPRLKRAPVTNEPRIPGRKPKNKTADDAIARVLFERGY